jgi:hypothetical protein
MLSSHFQATLSDLTVIASNPSLLPSERMRAVVAMSLFVQLGLVTDKRTIDLIQTLDKLVAMSPSVKAGIYFGKMQSGAMRGKTVMGITHDWNTTAASIGYPGDGFISLSMFIATHFDPHLNADEVNSVLQGWLSWAVAILKAHVEVQAPDTTNVWLTINDISMREFVAFTERKIAENSLDATVYDHMQILSEAYPVEQNVYEVADVAPDQQFRIHTGIGGASSRDQNFEITSVTFSDETVPVQRSAPEWLTSGNSTNYIPDEPPAPVKTPNFLSTIFKRS